MRERAFVEDDTVNLHVVSQQIESDVGIFGVVRPNPVLADGNVGVTLDDVGIQGVDDTHAVGDEVVERQIVGYRNLLHGVVDGVDFVSIGDVGERQFGEGVTPVIRSVQAGHVYRVIVR